VINNFLEKVNIGIIEKGAKMKKSFLPDTILRKNKISLLITKELLFNLEYPATLIRRLK
jgi:hypothetical protein